MDTLTITTIVPHSIRILLLVVFFGLPIVVSIVAILMDLIKSKKDKSLRSKAEDERTQLPRDPALCTHEWKTVDKGSCKDHIHSDHISSVVPQSWELLRCTHCATKHFICVNDNCPKRGECRTNHEGEQAVPGPIERELLGRLADKNGFEYKSYMLRDRFGNTRRAWSRIIPTTIPFSCPDCGGMVEGVDAKRVWRGSTGVDPTAFRCQDCGRTEKHDFGEPRVIERESDLCFAEPKGLQTACPKGGKHEWELVEEWSYICFPEGVDACTENMHLLEEVQQRRMRCQKCGEERID